MVASSPSGATSTAYPSSRSPCSMKPATLRSSSTTRIFMSRIIDGRCGTDSKESVKESSRSVRWQPREHEGEGRARPDRLFDGQPSPHHLGQTARHGEPEPGPEPRVRIEPLERLEDTRPQLRWDARSVVDHSEPHL